MVHEPSIRKQRALRSAARALELDPHQPQALAFALSEDADLHTWVARAEAANQVQPQSWLIWATLSFALAELGELDRRLSPDPVVQMLRLAPQHPYSWRAVAIQHAGAVEREQALRCAATARRLAPTDTQLLYLQASLMSELHACTELEAILHTLSNLDGPPTPRSRFLFVCAVPRAPTC